MKVAGVIAGLIGILVLVIVLAILIWYGHGLWLKTKFRIRHGRKGRFILFVYSNSPNWKDYIESNVLPRVENYSIALNWSERKKWKDQSPFEARVFRRFAGNSAFNPIAIILPPRGKVKVIRFWQGFRDFKHGNDKALRQAEEELFREIDQVTSKTD